MPRRPGVTVRVACPGDAAVVTALRIALRREERAVAIDPQDDDGAALLARTRRQLTSASQAFLVAEDGSDAVGVVRIALVGPENGNAHAMLTTAYVAPSHRRRGVMRHLVAAAETWCRARGVAEIRLRNHLRNAAADACWESLGFGAVQVVRQRHLDP